MIVFRITSSKYDTPIQACSGQGSIKFPGRWHIKGTPMVYTSTSLSLAMLETIANSQKYPLYRSLIYYEISIPYEKEEDIPKFPNLPPKWADQRYHSSTQTLGSNWIQARTSLAIRVPSVLIPRETNVLLNPNHPEFPFPQIQGPFPLEWDKRLFDK